MAGESHVHLRKHFDMWSLLVIALTLILFVVALFIKGLTHDLLLEAGVFLISVKLILMAYKHSIATDTMQQTVDEMHRVIQQLAAASSPPRPSQPTSRDTAACADAGPLEGNGA
jgi:hypothetical protein